MNPKDRELLWDTSLGYLAVPLETNCTSAWGHSPFPVHPVPNELQLALAASELFCALSQRRDEPQPAGTGI